MQKLCKLRKRLSHYDEEWSSSLVCCFAPTATAFSISKNTRSTSGNKTVTSESATKIAPATVWYTLSALTCLIASALTNFRKVTEYAIKHGYRFVKLLNQQKRNRQREERRSHKKLEQTQERILEVNCIIKRLYEDNVDGKISDKRFVELSADYERKQRELKNRAAALQPELHKSQSAISHAKKFMGMARKHLPFEKLITTFLARNGRKNRHACVHLWRERNPQAGH